MFDPEHWKPFLPNPAYDERTDPGFAPQALRNLARRMPPMAAATPLYGHAGLYDMTPDTHPIIGPAPDVPGLYFCVGFSAPSPIHERKNVTVRIF